MKKYGTYTRGEAVKDLWWYMYFQNFKGFFIHYLLKFLLPRDRQLKWGLFLSNFNNSWRLHGEIHVCNNKIPTPKELIEAVLVSHVKTTL